MRQLFQRMLGPQVRALHIRETDTSSTSTISFSDAPSNTRGRYMQQWLALLPANPLSNSFLKHANWVYTCAADVVFISAAFYFDQVTVIWSGDAQHSVSSNLVKLQMFSHSQNWSVQFLFRYRNLTIFRSNFCKVPYSMIEISWSTSELILENIICNC